MVIDILKSTDSSKQEGKLPIWSNGWKEVSCDNY